MMVRALLALALALSVGCEKPRSWEPVQVDTSLIEVASDKLLLRNDEVGEGKFASTATFVLVNATNRHEHDLEVTLGGELVDDAGKVVGTLEPSSLRVPKGKARMFALVDDQETQRPSATAARVTVTGAHEARHAPTVRVEEFYVHPEGDHLLASATVINTGRGAVKAVVIGAFYGANDEPLTRPFTVLALDAGTSHPVHFRSKPGAVKGIVYIGQAVY